MTIDPNTTSQTLSFLYIWCLWQTTTWSGFCRCFFSAIISQKRKTTEINKSCCQTHAQKHTKFRGKSFAAVLKCGIYWISDLSCNGKIWMRVTPMWGNENSAWDVQVNDDRFSTTILEMLIEKCGRKVKKKRLKIHIFGVWHLIFDSISIYSTIFEGKFRATICVKKCGQVRIYSGIPIRMGIHVWFVFVSCPMETFPELYSLNCILISANFPLLLMTHLCNSSNSHEFDPIEIYIFEQQLLGI